MKEFCGHCGSCIESSRWISADPDGCVRGIHLWMPRNTDWYSVPYVLDAGGIPINWAGVVVQIMFRVTEYDPVPLLAISSTGLTSSGQVFLSPSLGAPGAPPLPPGGIQWLTTKAVNATLTMRECQLEAVATWANGITTPILKALVHLEGGAFR